MKANLPSMESNLEDLLFDFAKDIKKTISWKTHSFQNEKHSNSATAYVQTKQA